MATHSSILAWRIPRTEGHGRLQSMDRKESDRTEVIQHACKEIAGFWTTFLHNIEPEGHLLLLLLLLLSCFSRVRLCETLQMAAHQAPPSLGFSRQEYWSGLPCPPPRDLPNSGIKPASLMSPALAGRFFTTSSIWEAQYFPNLTFFFQFQSVALYFFFHSKMV